MSEERTPAPDADVEMVDAQPELDQEELLHEKRLELLKSLTTMPFQWQILTDDFIASIDEKIPKLSTEVYSDHNQSQILFHEVVYSAKYHEDRLSIGKLSSILNASAEVKDAQALFFKFISIFNTFQLDEHLINLIKGFQKLPSKDMGKYLGDDSAIKKLNIINDYPRNRQEYILSNFVEQKKYNLLFEASEGFAKLAVLLYDAFDSDDTIFQSDYVASAIERLIGHYSLDPIKALDLILDILMHSISKDYRFCIDLLKKTQWWPRSNESDNSRLESLDKGGNQEAAALLGLKLKSSMKTKKLVPETMKVLIGILIKEGFISFGSIFKYCGPEEEYMEKVQDDAAKKVDEEIFKASANALALSGPLADDGEDGEEDAGSRPKSKAAPVKEKVVDTTSTEARALNYKIQLLKLTLSVGLYWPSIYMLTKYPYLVNVEPDIVPLILRLFKQIVAPLQKKISILSESELEELKTEKKTALPKRTAGSDAVELETFTYSTVEIFNPLLPNHSHKKFLFFYRGWNSDLPLAHDFEDLFKYSKELLAFAGAKIGGDTEFISLLTRCGIYDLEKSKNDPNYDEKLNNWFDYLRKFIFPASTVAVENSLTTSDIFDLLKKFPLQWRYNLYGELVNVISKQNDVVRLNYSKAEKQTKDVLKRITTENVKQMMRRFAKISFANPLPSFLVIVTQVESYDNLSNLIVDAARYFTEYAWDVLSFVLLMRLTARRNAIQSDGLNDALWLQSLSTFIAKLSKNYASMNLEPILTFIVKDLHSNNTIGLTILREIVNQMGGIQQRSNLSAKQVQMLNSGESLQKSINKVIFDTRDECTKPALRLLRTLTSSNILSELFILLADFQKSLVEKSDESAHYKVLSNQNDEVASVLHTYIELIKYFLKKNPELFEANVLDIKSLISSYGVDIPWVFELWRSHIDFGSSKLTDLSSFGSLSLSNKFYATFWSLSLYDINYDDSLYTQESQRLSDLNTSITDQLSITRREKLTTEIRAKETKLKKDQTFNEDILKQIPEDKEAHKLHHEKTMNDLKPVLEECNTFKESGGEEKVQQFFQYCVIPRAIHSETDAIFTGRFLTSLFSADESKTFAKVLFNSQFLDTLIYTITPLESDNLGLFLAELFGFYEGLRSTGDVGNDYKKEIFGWHNEALESIKLNIQSENYMSRRNVFTLLKNLITVYPIVEDHAEGIIESIQKVSSSEKRNDLKLASDAILAHIKSRSKKWIHLWDFYELGEEEKSAAIEKRDQLIKQREERILEEKRAEIVKQKLQREAEIASRTTSRGDSRMSSRPESRTESRTSDITEGSEVRLRPRFQETKDEDEDASLLEDFDKKEEPDEEITESTVKSNDRSKLETKKLPEGPKKVKDEEVVETKVEETKTPVSPADEKKEINTTKEDSSSKTDVENAAPDAIERKSSTTISPANNSETDESLQKLTENSRTSSKTSTTKSVDTYIPSSKTSSTTETSNRAKRRFKDVTASALSGDDIEKKLKAMRVAIIDGEFNVLKQVIDDKGVERDLDYIYGTSVNFSKDFKDLVFNYARELAGNNSVHVASLIRIVSQVQLSVDHFTKKNYSRTTSSGRKPLPPQEAITGSTSRPAEKWGPRGIPAGPSGQSGSRTYNQGYRQAGNAAGSYTPSSDSRQQNHGSRSRPPPPPPPPESGPGPNKRSNNSQRESGYVRDKRFRR